MVENSSPLSNFEKVDYKILLEFENILYKIKKLDKTILHSVSGKILPGRFLAILGTSGAGKSSLLNILAGRLHSSRSKLIKGNIKINGSSEYSLKAFKQKTAYVVQEDLVYETMTVRETIELSARLMLPSNLSISEKRQKVDKLIKSLNLEKCKNSYVGGKTIRGVSGGERKRVSIGKELISNPSLFFLDEPTSGLDSFTAFKIVHLLVDLAHTGRTVVSTIHQPNSEMFKLFDDLIVISSGHIVYNGPSSEVMKVFNKLGYPILKNSNPADQILTICNKAEKEPSKIEFLAKEYPLKMKECDIEHKGAEKLSSLKETNIKKPGTLSQIWSLFILRSFKNVIRQPSAFILRFLNTIFVALLTGILFFDLGYQGNDSFSRKAAIFYLLTSLIFNTLFSVILSYPIEKKIFINESLNGMYSNFSYIISKFAVEMPFNVIIAFLFQSIVYWMIGFYNSFEVFIIAFLVLIVATQTSYAFAILVGSAAPSPEIAIVINSLITIPSLLFCGFFTLPSQMESWISWTTYLDYYRYLLDMLLYNEFKNIEKIESCVGKVCMEITGMEYLEEIDLANLKFWLWFLISICFFLLFLGAAWLTLYFKTSNKTGISLENN